MKIAFLLYIIAPIGFYLMWREKKDNKKYPNSDQAKTARRDKAYREAEKMSQRYGHDSEQARTARQRLHDI